MARAPRSIDWTSIGTAPSDPDGDLAALRDEQRAIEIERWALEDAIARTIATGTGQPAPSYRLPRSLLQHPYLPMVCTAVLLLVAAYLGLG